MANPLLEQYLQDFNTYIYDMGYSFVDSASQPLIQYVSVSNQPNFPQYDQSNDWNFGVQEGDRLIAKVDNLVVGISEPAGTTQVELGVLFISLANADEFTLPFQEAMTSWCWGFGWGDETIDPKTRSMMNLAMIGALGKMHEWEIHCRGAITNGVTKQEIRAIIHVIGIYCGVPQALECFRVAKKVLKENNL